MDEGATMSSEPGICTLCGQPLPKPSWLVRITGTMAPTHTHKGAVGDACWVGMNKRLGITDPGPKPSHY